VSDLQTANSIDFERRFGGLRRLYGVDGAQRLFDAHVVVVGIGGVGSWAAEAVARSGVGRISLVDMDHVSESNINRQIHATTATIGASKVLAMQQRIALINPQAQVQLIDDFVTPANWAALVKQLHGSGGSLAVIDACDQTPAKTAMATWAIQSKACFVAVGAAGGKRLAHAVDCADLADTTHDPLLAQVRYRLRKHHGAARKGRIGVACVFSREPVMQPSQLCASSESFGSDGSLNCHGYGSSVAVTATFGHCAAGWVLDALAQGRGVLRPTPTFGKENGTQV
jgi:tRNA A37 threonylcarbamoyladenosine dehydratase